jgi:hypothetical protein
MRIPAIDCRALTLLLSATVPFFQMATALPLPSPDSYYLAPTYGGAQATKYTEATGRKIINDVTFVGTLGLSGYALYSIFKNEKAHLASTPEQRAENLRHKNAVKILADDRTARLKGMGLAEKLRTFKAWREMPLPI